MRSYVALSIPRDLVWSPSLSLFFFFFLPSSVSLLPPSFSSLCSFPSLFLFFLPFHLFLSLSLSFLSVSLSFLFYSFFSLPFALLFSTYLSIYCFFFLRLLLLFSSPLTHFLSKFLIFLTKNRLTFDLCDRRGSGRRNFRPPLIIHWPSATGIRGREWDGSFHRLLARIITTHTNATWSQHSVRRNDKKLC